jgi:hypothetical protein
MSIVFCAVLLLTLPVLVSVQVGAVGGKRVGFKGEILLGFLLTLLWAGYLEGV